MSFEKYVILLLSFTCGAQLPAQPWVGILSPDRAVDWSQSGVPGGIPAITSQCGPVIEPFGSSSAFASPHRINAAIQACSPGQFVLLDSGDFYLSSGITWGGKSGVVLRGKGAHQTSLHFNNADVCGGLHAVACIIDNDSVYQDTPHVQPGNAQAADWTGGYSQGSTRLTISRVGSAGIVNGQSIFLDQNLDQVFIETLKENGATVTAKATGRLPATFTNGATLRLFDARIFEYNTVAASIFNVDRQAGTFQYQAYHHGLPWSTGGVAVVDTGGPVVCAAFQLCGYKGAKSSKEGIGRNVNGSRRQIFQIVQVVSGCSSPCRGEGPFTIDITPGLYHAADGVMDPGIWWPLGVTGDAVENLTVDQTSVPRRAWGGIVIYDCSGCWVRGVREIDANRNHIWLFQSSQTTVESSYFYGTHKGGGTQSYGVESYLASNNVIQNNIFQRISAPFMAGPTEASVFAYNFAVNDPTGVPGYMAAAVWATHDVDQYSLYEGNVGPGARSDSTFANGDFNTYFRNRFAGDDFADNSYKSHYTYPIGLEFWNRYYNVIGNVLGAPGYHDTYESSPNTCGDGCTSADANRSIYALGFSGGAAQSCSNKEYCPPDENVAESLMRWGNYDTVNAAVRWQTTEVPDSITPFGNAIPATEALPASFYLSATPGWWLFPSQVSPSPWPPIGPDVQGGPGPGGYAYPIPAQSCYANVMNGTANGVSSALAFNASDCYSLPPAPPANLKATRAN